PDGAGKTTLSHEMQDLLGARYIHLTYRWKEKMHLYHFAAIRVAAHLAQHNPVIIDRWWPSELIYAEAYRGGSKVAKHFPLFEHVANKLGVVFVMCLPEDRERYLTHYNELKQRRVEMYDEGLNRVYDGYIDIYRSYLGIKENVCRYDMFDNFDNDTVSRGVVMREICHNILEFTEDYRSDL
ncbi:MAG TPA: hypothetical protein VF944_10545, partial [Candidatus Bathyarchaeia archaeon]